MAITTNLTEFMLNDGTTLQALDPDLNQVELSRAREVISFETFAQIEKAAGRVDASISLSGRWTADAGQVDATLDTLLSDSTAAVWEYYPEGNTSGKVKYSGTGLVETYAIQAQQPGVVQVSASIQVDGDVTRGTVV